MTIYTSVNKEQKESGALPPPEVVSEILAAQNKKNESKHGETEFVTVTVSRRRKRHTLLLCFALCAILVIAVSIIGCLYLFKHLKARKEERQFICGVDYLDNEGITSNGNNGADLSRPYSYAHRYGKFLEKVLINLEEEYEKIEVPTIGDTRKAVVLHDFNKNLTAVIDKHRSYCFILPLNRTLVMPPKDFWDFLSKLQSGYYVPDARIVKENYRVTTPPLRDLTALGLYISSECRYFETYMLVKEGEPLALAKRSACEFIGDKYCLGDAGIDKVVCFGISGCV